MTTANKRPLSPTIPASPYASTSKSTAIRSSTSNNPPVVPKFLTQPLPTLLRKFRAINAHEAHLRSSNPLGILNHHLAHARNRYPDVHPWSYNRIHLSSLPFPYINASPIDLGRPDERFIATQGPLSTAEGTVHFWEMVWQEQVEVVVMLTRVVEEGKEKCGEYYPEEVSAIKELGEGWGRVECVSLREEHGTEIRELRLVKRTRAEGADEVEIEESRTVWHFLFLAWPDQEVPQTPEDQKALLELIKMTRFRIDDVIRVQPEQAKKVYKPRIVHCSAGVGRTGTFIALDYLLQELEQGKFNHLVRDGGEADWEEIDPVFDAVKMLREQRMFMVYKPGQYVFLYRVLRENWEANKGKIGGRYAEGGSTEDNGPPTQKRKFSRDDSEGVEHGAEIAP